MGAAFGYLMLATSVVLSVVVFWLSARMADGWWAAREEKAIEFADMTNLEWPVGLISFLPRRARRVLHPVVYGAVGVLLGALHGAFIYVAWSGLEPQGPLLYVFYLSTLAIWLVVVGAVPFQTAQHRAAMRVRARGEAPAQ